MSSTLIFAAVMTVVIIVGGVVFRHLAERSAKQLPVSREGASPLLLPRASELVAGLRARRVAIGALLASVLLMFVPSFPHLESALWWASVIVYADLLICVLLYLFVTFRVKCVECKRFFMWKMQPAPPYLAGNSERSWLRNRRVQCIYCGQRYLLEDLSRN